MAISSIIEFSLNKLEEKDYVTPDTMNRTSFVQEQGAWIVGPIVARDSQFDEILKHIVGCGVEWHKEDESIIFKQGFKTKYFSSRFKNFKKLADVMSLEDFACNHTKFLDLQESINNRKSFYVYDRYSRQSYGTFDDFVRNVKENEVYYIGGMLVYQS